MRSNVGGPNVGGIDRWIRLLGGTVLLTLAFVHALSGGWLIAAYIFGVIGLGTGLTSFCPAYRIAGLNTHRMHHT